MPRLVKLISADGLVRYEGATGEYLPQIISRVCVRQLRPSVVMADSQVPDLVPTMRRDYERTGDRIDPEHGDLIHEYREVL